MLDPSAPFFQAYAKLKWADKHLHETHAIWEGFLESDFCSVVIEKEVRENGVEIDGLVVKTIRSFPIELVLTLGDAIHSMRCALDYAISEILHWKNTRITFPMDETRENLVASFATEPAQTGARTKGKGRNASIEQMVPEIGRFIVDTIRPYKGGNDALWALGKIDNTDKHRLLTPIFVPQTVENINMRDNHGNQLIDCSAVIENSGACRLIAMNASQGMKIESYGKATAEIFFNEAGIVEGQPLFPVLIQMRRAVGQTLESLSKFVVAAGWEPAT